MRRGKPRQLFEDAGLAGYPAQGERRVRPGSGACAGDDCGVLHTVCVGLAPGTIPDEARKHLPRYPQVSATLLGRLAVNAELQGRGLGAEHQRFPWRNHSIRRCPRAGYWKPLGNLFLRNKRGSSIESWPRVRPLSSKQGQTARCLPCPGRRWPIRVKPSGHFLSGVNSAFDCALRGGSPRHSVPDGRQPGE